MVELYAKSGGIHTNSHANDLKRCQSLMQPNDLELLPLQQLHQPSIDGKHSQCNSDSTCDHKQPLRHTPW